MGVFFEERCSRTVKGVVCLGFFDDNNVCDRCSKPSEEPVQQPPLSQLLAGTQSSGSQGSSSSKITSVAPNQTKPTNDYLDWPNYQVWPYPNLKELLERLGKVDKCKVEIFRSTGNDGARWFRCKTARKPVKSFETLLSLLRSENKAPGDHCLDLVQDASYHVIKSLGFYRSVTPLFFDIPCSIMKTDGGTKDSIFFSFQFLGQYAGDDRPSEASRVSTSPKFSFFDPKTGARREWLVSRISLFAKRRSNDTYYSLLFLDPVDTVLSVALKTLLLGDENSLPLPKSDHIVGVISSVMYMMALIFSQFLQDAERNLKSVTRPNLEKAPLLQDLVETTRELHELLDLWREAHCRVLAVQKLARDIMNHPFIIAGGLQGIIATSLRKPRGMFEDHIDTIGGLIEKTKSHISLIFNIATLYDSRAALEESRSANNFASSSSDVTSLTFIYLPISIAAAIFGMNVDLITGDRTQPTILAFIGLAAVLLVISTSILVIWSNKIRIKQWFGSWRTQGGLAENGSRGSV